MKKITILLIVLCYYTESGLFAQSTDSTQTHQVMLMARVQKDRMLLRWAMNTPVSWKKANTYGYRLERYTISREGNTLAQPEKLILKDQILPEPLAAWEDIIKTNDNAAIMAQALYGESFQVETRDGLSAIVNLAREQQQRFSFGLMAADQDFKVAQKAGLGDVDTTVKPDEKYLYKVIPLIPKTELKIKEGGIFTGLSDYEPLPKPLDLAGLFNDRNVMLTWNKKLLSETYNRYFVERSTDSITFENRNVLPFMNLNNGEVETTDRAFYIDSIANNIPYYYRIKGITPFGELGPASEIIFGQGKALLRYVPHLTAKKIISETEVVLHWEFPEAGTEAIKGFRLKRSDREDGIFQIVKENIPPQDRKTHYTGLQPSNYFKIEAIDNNGNTRESFAMLVQPVDSIPPAIPIGLSGTIDGTGVVRLLWKANTEDDLAGYRVYRANTQKEEFTQLTIAPWRKNNFRDSVGIKSLNAEVLYRVIAEDRRHNRSEPSAVFSLTKPDVIPPTAPVFTKYVVEDNSIHLQWAGSSATDIAEHDLYRKENTADSWNLITTFKDKTDSYIDKKTEQGGIYSYTLMAKDKSGLESTPSPAVTVVIPKTGLHPKIERFYGQADHKNGLIRLSWRYEEENVESYQLYRAVAEKPLQLYKTLPATAKGATDTMDINIGTAYHYLIRAIFKDGTYSEYNKTTINY